MIIALIALVAVLGVVLAACNESTVEDPAGSIPQDVRNDVTLAFMILMLIAGIALIVVVMMQKGTNDNVGVISGASDTYYGRNKEKGRESVLKKVTPEKGHLRTLRIHPHLFHHLLRGRCRGCHGLNKGTESDGSRNGSRFYLPCGNDADPSRNNSFRCFSAAEACQYVYYCLHRVAARQSSRHIASVQVPASKPAAPFPANRARASPYLKIFGDAPALRRFVGTPERNHPKISCSEVRAVPRLPIFG